MEILSEYLNLDIYSKLKISLQKLHRKITEIDLQELKFFLILSFFVNFSEAFKAGLKYQY